MLHLNPLFTPETPVWFHRELGPFEEKVAELFDADHAPHIIEEAQALDARLAITGGRDIGFLWIPEPSTGEIKGAGWVMIVQHDPELPFDEFVAGVAIAERSIGTKILRNVIDSPHDMPWGTSAFHELAVKHKKDGTEFHASTVWVYPEGDNAYGVTLMVNDAALVDPAAEALTAFVGGLEVVQEDS